MFDRQSQRSGEESLNLQAGNDIVIHVGPTLEDVRTIAREVFLENYVALRGVAEDLVRARADELLGQFLERLQKEKESSVGDAAQPRMLFAMFEAQKSYAKSGDQGLAELLVGLLVDLTGTPGRSLEGIVLEEALLVCPKLPEDAYDFLTLLFILRRLKFNYVHGESEFQKRHAALIPLFYRPEVPRGAGPSHLIYAGCASTSSIGIFPLADGFKEGYPDVFGNATTPHILDVLRRVDPSVSHFVDGYDDSELAQMSLTSVGIAIALANLKRKTGGTLSAPLNVWIK